MSKVFKYLSCLHNFPVDGVLNTFLREQIHGRGTLIPFHFLGKQVRYINGKWAILCKKRESIQIIEFSGKELTLW